MAVKPRDTAVHLTTESTHALFIGTHSEIEDAYPCLSLNDYSF